ncbi:L-seryl-tRNA(Sec) selenium transferase [uncultured Campylobacter sp.]|uniref:L-seryl-tRNA(Sec) selenium transferase n=1 Tax=uncultured Campylobacter sp. TaxID=218934 RepID=UPI002629A07B|nr:L-seryl-tRNA(Sec) selenium transferase [uncultured Campylobacter sp.]
MQQIKLPKIDKIANAQEFQNCLRPQIIKIAQELIEEARREALQGGELASESEIIARIKSRYEKFQNLSLKPLINATGVVLHTNLGRSVIGAEILARAQKIITSYSNLEYDLSEGARGNRYDYIALLCSELFGAQDALVVNNNAAAVFLVLNTFARGREVVVSRGELVEIGGSFRVSEVMANSGAKLTEIGTTNKTKPDDYEEAINENTAILMKVHRSNFKISGFSSSVSAAEVAALARRASQAKREFLALRAASFKNLADLCGGSSDTDGEILNSAPNGLSLAAASANSLNLKSDEPSAKSERFYEGGAGDKSEISKIYPAKFSMKKAESFNEIIDYYDLGSGYASELGFGLGKSEPSIFELLKSGVRLLSFSGDKLFGSVQCGIILGDRELIARLRKNQLLRMLRVDKITLSLLAETIKAYINKEFHLIRTIDQIHLGLDELRERAELVQSRIGVKSQIVPTTTFVGGGTMPSASYPSVALAILDGADPQSTQAKFRAAGIIGRIEDDKFLLDFRSILKSDLQDLIKKIGEIYE